MVYLLKNIYIFKLFIYKLFEKNKIFKNYTFYGVKMVKNINLRVFFFIPSRIAY